MNGFEFIYRNKNDFKINLFINSNYISDESYQILSVIISGYIIE